MLPPFKCSQLHAWSTGLKSGNASLAKGSSEAHQEASQPRHQIQKPTGIHPSLFYLLWNVSFSFKLDGTAKHKVILSVWSVSIHVLSSRNFSARHQTLLRFSLFSLTFSQQPKRRSITCFLGRFSISHYTRGFLDLINLSKAMQQNQPIDLAWKSQKWSYLLAICTSCWEQQTSMRNAELTFTPNAGELKKE